MTPAQQINSQILAFIRKRENQFRVVRREGRSIPHYARKIQTIANIRIQMEGAASYSLLGQAKVVVRLEYQIIDILPAHDSRFTTMRKKMLSLIAYCHEQVNTEAPCNLPSPEEWLDADYKQHHGTTADHLPR